MRKLTCKAQWYGRIFLKVNRYFPSTQLCQHC
ncbi:zinc ribbon domain-containing protein [Succinatimonas hippei]